MRWEVGSEIHFARCRRDIPLAEKEKEMSKEIKYMKIRSRNATMIQLYGNKLKLYEWLISQRSNLLHMELQFSDRYVNISVSATKADGCDCVRFKMIGYTHAYRWSTIYIPVTAEQEARIFEKACHMAGLIYQELECHLNIEPNQFISEQRTHKNGCYYGPNAIKYDTAGVFLSFISKRRWWNPSNERQWCNETVGLLMMVVWPDIFFMMFSGENIPPQEQTPDQTAYMIQYYFENTVDLGNPTQADIDKIIEKC